MGVTESILGTRVLGFRRPPGLPSLEVVLSGLGLGVASFISMCSIFCIGWVPWGVLFVEKARCWTHLFHLLHFVLFSGLHVLPSWFERESISRLDILLFVVPPLEAGR